MVDNTNPTSQFHPYQPQDKEPQTGSSTSTGLGGLLGKFGLDSSKIGALGSSLGSGLNGGLGKVRSTAQTNPGMVLGGLAALAIGAGLLRKRSMR
ncbi:MAG TPA: LPXTG cell wall anchor domain-containing protein [Thermoanaerobaculia bacterium]|nr:LPXTG cell wall anchor domain-containing protein [Thermoanaerobaculia bacterium]